MCDMRPVPPEKKLIASRARAAVVTIDGKNMHKGVLRARATPSVPQTIRTARPIPVSGLPTMVALAVASCKSIAVCSGRGNVIPTPATVVAKL